MKLKGILVIAFVAISMTGFSQRWKLNRYEALFGIGSTNIYGDIGGAATRDNLFGLKDIRINETRYALYGGIRYKIQKDLAIKFNLIYGKGIGNDKGSVNDERGYSFKTSIFEPSVQLEYSFLSEERKVSISRLYNRRGMVNNFALLSAYGFVGAGGVIASPKVDLNGNDPILHKNTFKEKSNFSVAFPIGLGLKYSIDKNWSIGFEFGRRFAFSDYLEGMSSTISDFNDTYYFGIFQASYKLKTNRQGIPIFLVRKQRTNR
ncbi:MAG: hypothetical protein HC830_04300 [Bacteroidetes bacterium]|nr:hypothetical protein [Bacteroidota bacterium]